MSVALVFSTSRREGLIGLSTLRIVSTSLTFRCLRLGLKDGFDSAALVHRAVALSNLIQGEGKVEDFARMDVFSPDHIDYLPMEAADWCGASMKLHVRSEQ